MAQDADDLIDFVASVSGDGALRVEESLGEGYVRLRVGEAERRQAKHDIRCVEDAVVEMLRNARDADAKHIYVATWRDSDMRIVVMLDDGCGIPADMHDRVFDARVTSKLESVHVDRWGVHGRGMALFSIRENASSARVMSSAAGAGSSIRVDLDTTKLGEKVDQSTWPAVGKDEDGRQAVVRGPHNIVRTCCEFALEERSRCEVYLGSASEMVATARSRVHSDLDPTSLLFVDDVSSLPVLERLLVPADAAELIAVSSSLGLDISERTAHRILSGQIRPVRSVLAHLTHHADAHSPEVDLTRNHRGLKVSPDDVEGFSRLMERDFDYLADRYYLSLSDAPRVHVSRDRISVTFDIDERD